MDGDDLILLQSSVVERVESNGLEHLRSSHAPTPARVHLHPGRRSVSGTRSSTRRPYSLLLLTFAAKGILHCDGVCSAMVEFTMGAREAAISSTTKLTSAVQITFLPLSGPLFVHCIHSPDLARSQR